MGIVKGSVTISISNPGNYQVTMPESDLDIIGFSPLGQANTYAAPPIIGVYIDASNIAYFPMAISANYTTRKYTPVHVKLKGTVLNLNIPYIISGPSGTGLTIFYGDPDGSEIEYTSLKGVTFTYVNTSTTAPATGTLSITFPSGNIRITGVFVQGYNPGALGYINFITGTGKSLTIPFSTAPDPMDLPDNIYALDLDSATTLSINFSIGENSGGNAQLVGIIYYE